MIRATYQLCGVNAPRVPSEPGVYEIRSRWGAERYVGSTVDLNERFRNHLRKLMKGNHPNRKLQRVYNRRGGVLHFRILARCAPYSLVRVEQIHITRVYLQRGTVLNNVKVAAGHAGRL